jgi:hypothetical protein
MTAKAIKMWLIGAGLLIVLGRLLWITYVAPDSCLNAGGNWDSDARTCQMPTETPAG